MSAIRTDLSPDARSMAKGASFNLAGIAAASVLGVGFNLVAVRIVPVHLFGLYALAVTVVTLAQVPALMGLDTATVRYVAIGAERHDSRAVSGSLQTGLIASAVAAAVVFVVLWTQAEWICTGLFNKPAGAESVRIIALALPALVLLRVTIAGIQGLGLMRRTAWLPAARVGSALFLALLVAVLGSGVTGLAMAWSAAAWVALAAALVTLHKVHRTVFWPVPSAWRFRQMLWFAIPQTLTGMMFLAVIWTDTLMVAHYLTAADVAVYAIATRLLAPSSALSSAIGQMFSPRIAADSVRTTGRALSEMLKRVTRWNTVLSMPIFLTLMVIPSALLALFGDRYTAGAEALVILAIGQLVNTAAGPLGQVINMSGRPYLSMCNNAAVATLNIIMCVVLVPAYGLPGAALSTTLSLTLVNAIKVVQVHHLFATFPFNADTLKVLGAGAVAAAAAASVTAVVMLGELATVGLIPLLLTLIYVGMLRVLGFSSDDRDVMVAAKTRLRGSFGLSPRTGSSTGDA